MSLLSKPSEEFSLKNIRIYQNSFCSVMTRQQHLWKQKNTTVFIANQWLHIVLKKYEM
jgi:hypothetical protein